MLLMLLYLGCELAAFGGVVRQMLEDVQQRIVFRAQRYIQTDIRGYNPAPGDLAYPDKLIVANEATTQDETISDSDSVFDTSGTEVRMCQGVYVFASLFTLCTTYHMSE